MSTEINHNKLLVTKIIFYIVYNSIIIIYRAQSFKV